MMIDGSIWDPGLSADQKVNSLLWFSCNLNDPESLWGSPVLQLAPGSGLTTLAGPLVLEFVDPLMNITDFSVMFE